MKVRQILENHRYNIIRVETASSKDADMTSKKGQIKVPYRVLERLFGKPHSYSRDQDTAHEWVLTFDFKDSISLSDDPDATESTIVTIYDRLNHGDPSQIDEWTVGGKHQHALWILQDYLDQRIHRSNT